VFGRRLSDLQVVSSTELLVDLIVEPGTPPRSIEIVGLRPIGPSTYEVMARVALEIIP
jgi:hypothetical protein